jgi:hypothetical protein
MSNGKIRFGLWYDFRNPGAVAAARRPALLRGFSSQITSGQGPVWGQPVWKRREICGPDGFRLG